MEDRSKEGLKYLAGALVPASVAVVSQNPLVKLVAAAFAAWAISKAGECFQDTAKQAYNQLQQASNNLLLH